MENLGARASSPACGDVGNHAKNAAADGRAPKGAPMGPLGARASSPADGDVHGDAKNAAEDGRAPNDVDKGAKNAAGDGHAPRGWHSRGYLPHRDAGAIYQMITYRLADALPNEVALRLAGELDARDGDSAYRARIEAYLDAGHGECWLRRADVAGIVLDSWRHFDGERYDLVAWVIMPNHVHVAVRMREKSLSDVVHGWKSFTARRINTLLNRSGKVWQDDYWDRYIRDERHYAAAVAYIHDNPVKAGLALRAEEWEWSSMGARAASPAGCKGV